MTELPWRSAVTPASPMATPNGCKSHIYRELRKSDRSTVPGTKQVLPEQLLNE